MKYSLIALVTSLFMILNISCSNNNIFGGLTGSKSNSNAGGGSSTGASDGDGFEPSKNLSDGNIVWKRYRAFEQGLMAGLELNKTQLCSEMGSFSCIDKVHLTVLGGNEPFDAAQHERLEAPSVLTSVAVSRVLMTACSQRADMDEQAGQSGAAVFNKFALSGANVDAGSVMAQATELYKRLLARNPTDEELALIGQAKDSFSSPKSLAIAMCYAIGSHIENIFI